jgi:hypothetical protein
MERYYVEDVEIGNPDLHRGGGVLSDAVAAAMTRRALLHGKDNPPAHRLQSVCASP